MPRDLELLRRAEQRQAAAPLGMDPRQPRQEVGQMRTAGLEADLLAMPAEEGFQLQVSGGAFTFMFGVSPFGGSSDVFTTES